MRASILLPSAYSKLFSSAATQGIGLAYKNPFRDLEQYLEIPLLTENDSIFSPSVEDMKLAQDMFVPKGNNKIKLVTRTINSETFPVQDLPEVSFLGRSNVGKSSLLQSIFKEAENLRIRVSKRPGCTKSLHFYQVSSKLSLVDMPGYGHNQPQWFESLMYSYFKKRKNLMRTFLLVDGKVGFTAADEIALKILEDFKVPFALVMTKIDKASDSRRLKNVLHLQSVKNQLTSVSCFPQPFMVSSHTFEGMGHLLAFIAHVTGNLSVESHRRSSV